MPPEPSELLDRDRYQRSSRDLVSSSTFAVTRQAAAVVIAAQSQHRSGYVPTPALAQPHAASGQRKVLVVHLLVHGIDSGSVVPLLLSWLDQMLWSAYMSMAKVCMWRAALALSCRVPSGRHSWQS